MFQPILLAALSTLATSMPAPQTSTTPPQDWNPQPNPQANYTIPPLSEQFTLTMDVGGVAYPINNLYNGTAYVSDITVSDGGPNTVGHLYFNPNPADPSGPQALNFVISDYTSGMGLFDVGDDEGVVKSVVADVGYQQFEWLADDGVLSHTLDDALNGFFACEDEAYGQPGIFLKWGTPQSNGQAPMGCEYTTVRLVCDIEGGATDCATLKVPASS